MAQSLAPLTGALNEAKAAGDVKFAQLYHTLARAMGQKAAAFATNSIVTHNKEKASVKDAIAALVSAGDLQT